MDVKDSFETYEEYKEEYLDDIHISSQIEGVTYNEYFQSEMLDELCAMGEVIDPISLEVNKRGRNNRLMGFDAYAFDENDNSLVLISNEFRDSLTETLTMTEINKVQTKMLNFLDEARDGTLSKYFDMFDDALILGKDMAERVANGFASDDVSPIDKIKLIIITNQDISESIKILPTSDFYGKPVSLSIWGPQRLYDLARSGRERESILIKTEKFGLDGIPCIKADMIGNTDYDAYLAIIPGEFLHKIYYEYGSHLLEGNVRAFLSNRGKINKGIRETIRNEPTKFFTYNNGIACTASAVEFSDDGRKIVGIEDLQIINGGQTTASLTSAALKDKASLENIFVQMKLTVVKNDDYEMMIQNISKYSNSQNKVTDADFFSNHAFHRKFAELASKNAVIVSDVLVGGSFWYYERSRGKYEQEQFKLRTESQKANFKLKYPKSQVIKKEELAKYFTAARLLRPDVVSTGATKVMRFFGEWIDKAYLNRPEEFNNQFFKVCICYAIIYRETDKIVSTAEWYNKGGYKLNIVPYTVSKLFSLIPKGESIDFNRIWKQQKLYSSLANQIGVIAQKTNEFIQRSSSNGVIVTEHFKKQKTWDEFNGVYMGLSEEFKNDLLSTFVANENVKDGVSIIQDNQDLDIESEISNLGAPYWRNLIEEGIKRDLLNPFEISVLGVAAGMDKPRSKAPSSKQAKYIWRIREKLGDSGIVI